MKIILMSVLLLALPQFAGAAHHKNDGAEGITLKKRQPDSTMTVTSVNVGTEQTTITATGKMGQYGRVYTTYNLSLNADRTGGMVNGTGRGVIDENTIVAGFFAGVWQREGSTIVMNNVVNISDGSQNYDVITFDARKNTLVHQVFIIK